MGGMCSRQDPARIIIQGLDAAGKTTLLYRLKLGEVVTTIPTIGFNVESIKSSTGLTVTAWDLGGRDKIRPLYRHYYNNTAGIIYVVDSSDTERLDLALEELDRWVLHEDELKDCVVMLLANKQDLGNALSAEAIEDRLQAYHKFWKKDLSVSLFVMPCSARADVAKEMHQAFDFFVRMIKMKQEGNLRNRFYPRAWESANQEANSEKATANDVTMFHRLKTSVFKNPFQLMKSFLFY